MGVLGDSVQQDPCWETVREDVHATAACDHANLLELVYCGDVKIHTE